MPLTGASGRLPDTFDQVAPALDVLKTCPEPKPLVVAYATDESVGLTAMSLTKRRGMTSADVSVQVGVPEVAFVLTSSCPVEVPAYTTSGLSFAGPMAVIVDGKCWLIATHGEATAFVVRQTRSVPKYSVEADAGLMTNGA